MTVAIIRSSNQLKRIKKVYPGIWSEEIYRISEQYIEDKCCICHREYSEMKPRILYECNHSTHLECIIQYFSKLNHYNSIVEYIKKKLNRKIIQDQDKFYEGKIQQNKDQMKLFNTLFDPKTNHLPGNLNNYYLYLFNDIENIDNERNKNIDYKKTNHSLNNEIISQYNIINHSSSIEKEESNVDSCKNIGCENHIKDSIKFNYSTNVEPQMTLIHPNNSTNSNNPSVFENINQTDPFDNTYKIKFDTNVNFNDLNRNPFNLPANSIDQIEKIIIQQFLSEYCFDFHSLDRSKLIKCPVCSKSPILSKTKLLLSSKKCASLYFVQKVNSFKDVMKLKFKHNE